MLRETHQRKDIPAVYPNPAIPRYEPVLANVPAIDNVMCHQDISFPPIANDWKLVVFLRPTFPMNNTIPK